MLKTEKRLPRERFGAVFSKGRVVHGQFFTLHALSGGKNVSRGAVVVSKRVVKGAVHRHFLKRRAAAVLKTLLPAALVSPSLDVVMVAKKSAATVSFVEIQKDIEELFSRVQET